MGVWTADPLALAGAGVALALYGQGFRRLRRRRKDAAPAGHAVLFVLGVAVAVLALVSPIDAVGEEKLLSAHMLQHLMLGDLAPLLIVCGLRGPLSVFVLPAPALRVAAGEQWLRRLLAWLLRPVVSFGCWAVAVAAWHVPAAYDFAIGHPWAHVLEHLSFMLAGTLVWVQIVDPARQRRLSYGGRALFAGAVFLVGMGLGEILLLTGPLYPHYAHVVDRPFGFTAGEDQSKAALLMMAEQVTTLGTAAALLFWSHMEHVDYDVVEPAEISAKPS